MKVLSSLVVLMLATPALAETIALKVTCSVNAEYDELDEADLRNDGWKIVEDEYGDNAYELDIKIEREQLPLSKYIGSAYVSLSKAGLLRVGMSVGDADASASSELQLPVVNGRLLAFPLMTLTSSGGDHASGMWNFSCKTHIGVK